jgi:hypothetical protein
LRIFAYGHPFSTCDDCGGQGIEWKMVAKRVAFVRIDPGIEMVVPLLGLTPVPSESSVDRPVPYDAGPEWIYI